MPIYEFACENCRIRFEILVKRAGRLRYGTCPKCKRRCLRALSKFVAIGSGMRLKPQQTESPIQHQQAEKKHGGHAVTGFQIAGGAEESVIENCTVNGADVGLSITPGTKVRVKNLSAPGAKTFMEVVRRGPNNERLD